VISEQSGLSNVLAKAQSFGINLDRHDPTCRLILQLSKSGVRGYQFEAAEASFELLIREALGQRYQFYIEGLQVNCSCAKDTEVLSTSALATVMLTVRGREILETAESKGPISALDNALRKALVNFYPEIETFHLTDYKVRILDGSADTSATTRVFAESSNGTQYWTTVGVSANIITASCQAIIESIEYGLLLHERVKLALTTISGINTSQEAKV
jgi:2-isopropylmalate synthase